MNLSVALFSDAKMIPPITYLGLKLLCLIFSKKGPQILSRFTKPSFGCLFWLSPHSHFPALYDSSSLLLFLFFLLISLLLLFLLLLLCLHFSSPCFSSSPSLLSAPPPPPSFLCMCEAMCCPCVIVLATHSESSCSILARAVVGCSADILPTQDSPVAPLPNALSRDDRVGAAIKRHPPPVAKPTAEAGPPAPAVPVFSHERDRERQTWRRHRFLQRHSHRLQLHPHSPHLPLFVVCLHQDRHWIRTSCHSSPRPDHFRWR